MPRGVPDERDHTTPSARDERRGDVHQEESSHEPSEEDVSCCDDDRRGGDRSLSAATNAAFAEDTKVRTVLTQRLAARGMEAQEISERASAAFANFRPSMFSAAERVRRTYLAPGEDLADTMRNVVERGVATMRETADDRTLHVHLGEGFGSLAAAPAAGAGATRRVGFDDLMKYIGKKLGRSPTLTTDPTRTACEAEARANEVLTQVESTGTTPTTPTVPTPTPASPNGDDDAPRVKAFVARHVEDLLAKTVPPEDELRYDVQPRAKLGIPSARWTRSSSAPARPT